MKLYLYVLLLLFSSKTSAQHLEEKLKFRSINSFGLLTGSRGEALSVQTIAGLKAKKWFAGIGTGLDFYEARTIPVFLDFRQDLQKKSNTPYVYGDIGTNFLWLKSVNQFQSTDPGSSKPQLYYEAGIGYRISSIDKKAILFSAGYSLKQVRQRFKSFSQAPTIELQDDNYEHYKLIYRRIVIRLGLEL